MMSALISADDSADDVPVKDLTSTLNAASTQPFNKESVFVPNSRARQAVSKISRDELEDRYLRLQDENLLLKQHANKQEEKIKRMATKLIRIVKERKKTEQASAAGHVVMGRNIEMEEMVEELQDRIQELEKQNTILKQRFLLAKQQFQMQTRRPTLYSNIQSRTNSGLRKFREDTIVPSPQPITPREGMRQVEGEVGSRPPQGIFPRYGHSLLDEARSEIRNLENVNEMQRAQMEELERAAEILRGQLRSKEREYEESLLYLKEQQTTGQRSIIKENVEMIKLQKHLAEKQNSFTVLEGRFLQLQESQKTMKASHDAAMTRVEELTNHLKNERLERLGLETQLQSKAQQDRRSDELLARIRDLEKERDLLKENCDKLMNSASDVSQEQKWKTREQQLKLQIAQLEMTMKADLSDKNQILDKIKRERDLKEKIMQENEELQRRCLEQKQHLDELNDKLKFFTKENEMEATELSEALLLIKTRKNKSNLGFLEKVDEIHMDAEHSLKALQAAYAKTVQELEKTRNMLIIQDKINKDYQTEVHTVTQRMEDLKLENELKQQKLAQLLDTRAAKIKKLEAQLKDIAYGTKTHVFRPDITDDDIVDEFDETVHLARGENILEIHLGPARFSSDALDHLGDKDPSTFCTYAFYDFVLQSTAVVRGPQPTYDLTSQYLVKVDELFLHYLHSSSITVEAHLAEGLAFRTIAAGQIHLNQVLEREGKLFGTLQLLGINDVVQVFGALEYWLRLKVPMVQAISLYKERVKALGYLNSSVNEQNQASAVPFSSASPKDGNLNELFITVRCCSKLKPRGPHLPSAYVMYKFNDFPDHDTPVIPSSNDPQFEDHKVFPILMNSELDDYLRTEALILYVFDDLDWENNLYLGKARVPLISLAHDKAVTGTFELKDPHGFPRGYIDVTLKWKFTYLPSSGSVITVEKPKFITKESPSNLAADETTMQTCNKERDLPPSENSHQTPLPKPRLRTLTKPASKRVSFFNVPELEKQEGDVALPSSNEEPKPSTNSSNIQQKVQVDEVLQASAVTEEEDLSEGQMITVSTMSLSDESEISEEIQEPDDDMRQVEVSDLSESILSDSDECIMPAQTSKARKQPAERIRVEIVSLSLNPGSRVFMDSTVVKLFVEYNFLDLPSEETPLSLPKPLPGQSIYYNYSHVIHVDAENNQARRRMLRAVLEGRNRNMENIRFTVVSDPPEEEAQEKECEEVGVAYFRIPEILEKQRDMTDVYLNIVDVQDNREVVGSLRVTVEALEALRSIMEDPDHDHSKLQSVSHLSVCE